MPACHRRGGVYIRHLPAGTLGTMLRHITQCMHHTNYARIHLGLNIPKLGSAWHMHNTQYASGTKHLAVCESHIFNNFVVAEADNASCRLSHLFHYVCCQNDNLNALCAYSRAVETLMSRCIFCTFRQLAIGNGRVPQACPSLF
jgi:hypothetical protein